MIAYKGPEAEKQPHESFDYLEEFREFLRWKTGDAILVAEANVAPDQILNYFGERGQRMTMVINFFVNPHPFLAIAEQSPEPIERALRQLPQIPILSHWAYFVRNHDELDLSRLSQSEREIVFALLVRSQPCKFINEASVPGWRQCSVGASICSYCFKV